MSFKKGLLSLAAVAAIGTAGGLATFGGFVGTTNATGSFSSGKVLPTMSVTDASGNNPFKISNMVVGDSATGYINVHNDGPTAFKYVTVTMTPSDATNVLNHDIWFSAPTLSTPNSSFVGISNWGLGSVENSALTYNKRISSGGGVAIPFTLLLHPTDNQGNTLGDIPNTDPIQNDAGETITFTVEAYQRDGVARTYQDSVDL